MHIAFVASECVPFSKTGGLADVVGALPKALTSLGHQVTVWLPRYRQTALDAARVVLPSVTIPFDDRYRFCSVLDGGKRDGVQFYFIEYPQFFDREYLYGTPAGDYHDNAERFTLFCRAVLEGAKATGAPDIFHCHDWQSALVPILLKSAYGDDPQLGHVPTLFTIHNIGYQGVFPADILPLLMLSWDLFTLNKLEFYGQVNLLKGALVYSDMVNTVSRRYAVEIQTPEYGFGLEGVLRQRSGSVFGILNGVDYSLWDPRTDKYIAAPYSADDLHNKMANKRAVLERFGLHDADANTPLLAFISRFASQKGIDLITQIADRLLHEEVLLIGLGMGDREYTEQMERLHQRYPKKFGLEVGYDTPMSHLIEAGADMFLMPSRYEPCGLNQIYSLRYGTVPIVRATGGLDDTVEPWDPVRESGTGFKFGAYNGESFLDKIREALAAFKQKEKWHKLMRNGMAQDFSWHRSAGEYDKLYQKLLHAKPKQP